MPRTRNLSPAAAAVEYLPPSDAQRLDFAHLFRGRAPVEVDLGCGDGAYLAALASENPGRNFVGIERLAGRIRSACTRVAARQLTNVRLLRTDAAHAVEHLFARGSVATFHLMFPDPWPKRRHHRRRLVTDAFFLAMARALALSGTVRIATDHHDYFEQIARSASNAAGFESFLSDDHIVPATTFEQRFRSAGAPIYRLLLRKTCDVR